jgi:lipopolysaccharide transport system ATP-binding protein
MRPIIILEGLSKRYEIGRRFGALRSVPALLRRLQPGHRSTSDGHPGKWALKNVDLEILPGEVFGVLGRNGAGKSTLLKILSRVTQPTSGRALLYGRLGSLLEIGAGFHPELTGRENVYMNAAVLGMSRQETRSKFDEIVAFSGIGDYLDSPVKHYSSGMYVRLAFSVSAHVAPEILLIDEVLAVGDEGFQRKCLQKVAELRNQGATLLLVSHDLNVVRQVCTRVAWLRDGSVRALGPAEDVARAYHEYMVSLEQDAQAQAIGNGRSRPRTGGEDASTRITSVKLLNAEGREVSTFETGERIKVAIAYRTGTRLDRPVFAIGIEKLDGTICYSCTTLRDGVAAPSIRGEGVVEIEFDEVNLLKSGYRVNAGVWNADDNVQLDTYLGAAFFQMDCSRPELGAFYLKHRWHFPVSRDQEP